MVEVMGSEVMVVEVGVDAGGGDGGVRGDGGAGGDGGWGRR